MIQQCLLIVLLTQTRLGWTQTPSNSTVPCTIPSFASVGVIVAGGNGQGAQAQQLNLPFGLYIDSNNGIYIGDVGNDRVQFWSAGATTGVTVAGGQGFGSNSSQLDGARDVYVNSGNNLLVLDTGNRRIQQYNRASSSIIGTTIMTNLPISCRNMFIEPISNTLYLSDMYNHRVLRMPTSTVVAGGNGFGSQPNQLYYPAGLYVTPTGTIYVADAFNDRIQMWTSGASSGLTVAGGHGRGSAANQLNSPMHVIYMPSTGNLIVTDSGNARIQVWAPNATCGITVISSQFTYPMTSSFDLIGRYLYVLDQVACQVKRFTLISNNSLCVPGNCSAVALPTAAPVPSTTSPIASGNSSITSGNMVSTEVHMNEKIPAWAIIILTVGAVFIIVIASFIYVLIKMSKSQTQVKPFA